ncbi:MAG: rod shape-determining protein RodA [Actinomycetota bacterium]
MAYMGHVESFGRQRVRSGLLSTKHPLRHVDLTLFAAAIVLAVLGCVAIYAATRPSQLAFGHDPNSFLKRQVAFFALALVVFVITMLFDYRQLRGVAPIVYGVGIAALILVLTPIGHSAAGAQRWITLGFLQIQPSEIMKLALIVVLSALWTERNADSGPVKVALAVALAVVPVALIYLQPDLGTVLVLAFLAFAIVLVSGAQLRWLAILAVLATGGIALILNLGLLHSYQVNRLTAFLDPKSSNAAAAAAQHNLQQSKIAVSSGGLTGKGLFRGTQTNLDYVPENQTDFIFTVVGEETGFMGSVLVIGLLAFIIWRAIRIAMLSKDQFGTRLAAGVAAMLAFQLFINVGMTIGLVPIVGIPLPFVSYGGSSLLTSFCAVGILMNIHMRRFV